MFRFSLIIIMQTLHSYSNPFYTFPHRGHNVHHPAQAAADLPALVSSHYRAGLLLVFLQRPGRWWWLVHDHELHRTRTHVQLLHGSSCWTSCAETLRHPHHILPDCSDGHGAGSKCASVPMDAGWRLPFLHG